LQSESKRQIRVFSLKTEKEIRNVFSKGKKDGNQYSVFYYRRNTKPYLRMGVFVPKAVFKKAVDRNRAKRTIKEVIRQEKSNLQGLDIICVLKKCRREEVSLKTFHQRITPLLRKIR